MKITLSNQIEITELDGLEEDLIRSSCTFSNPKYFEALKQNRYTGNINRKIELFEATDTGLKIPMGCKWLVDEEADEVHDHRNTHPVIIPFIGILRAYQQDLVDSALHAEGGVLVAATGSGKTVAAIGLAALLSQRCLILVKSGDLSTQWVEAINQFTGFDAGLIRRGKKIQGNQFTVGLVQSLVKMDLSNLDYGLVIADECHNAPANQFYTVINGLNCKYKYGLSATPQRRDGLEFMIHAALGEIVAEIDEDQLLGKVLGVEIRPVKHPFSGNPESWGAFVNTLIDDGSRNNLIIALARQQTKPTIILCSQVRHCELLTTMAQQAGLKPLLIHGQLPAKLRTERMILAQKAGLIIGTAQLLSEGIDLPPLEVLIFASPMSAVIEKQGDPAATKLIQSIGRIRRPYPGKNFAIVYDLVDRCGFGIAAYRKRNQIYQLQGWQLEGYGDDWEYDDEY
jgi:superfamily II DNA or RNA helicase